MRTGLAGLEEERRLAYVGLTRAKRDATILFAANRRVHGQWQSSIPSRFVDELPPEFVDMDSEHGVYAGGGAFGAVARLGMDARWLRGRSCAHAGAGYETQT